METKLVFALLHGLWLWHEPADTILGRFLPDRRWTPMVLLALSIGFGISAFYSLDMVPRKHRELLAYPALICAGLCIGSLEGRHTFLSSLPGSYSYLVQQDRIV